MASTHEDIRRSTEIRRPSDLSFGVTFSIFFIAVGILRSVNGGLETVWFAVAAAFLALALLRPILLRPLNTIWFVIGRSLNRVVTPLLMGLVFFVVVTPIGVIARLLKKNPLSLQIDRSCDTYWLDRGQLRPTNTSMRNQF